MAEFLLELLSEEIPARMQARAAEDLQRLFCQGLDKAGLTYTAARGLVTPRRLVLVVDGLPERQPDVREERKGPRVGSPAKAVEGFLRAAGLDSVEQAEVRETDKGRFYFAASVKAGRPTAEVLAESIGAMIRGFPWPKSMRWADTQMTWVRPLQGILAVFAGNVVPLTLDLQGGPAPALAAGDTTVGHRFLAPAPLRVADFADYQAKLRAGKVILDPDERRRVIAGDAARLAATEGLSVRDDPGLLDEVTGLVEWPVVHIGRIDAAFMDVPSEVLITAMRMHQKYFALTTAEGALAPRFLVVANTETADGGASVVAGNERVLRARLSDAKYFWDQDRKQSLESRVPKLAERVFHAKLGSDLKRTERLQALARYLAPTVGADPDLAEQAARLCKADLTTQMVGEFPELQGVMGRYYALHDGELPELPEVADAIRDHYAPQGPNDRCPTAPVSVAVALADKIDTLAGFFAINEKPTGSRDPFALRRAALGLIRLIVENKLRISLRQVVCEAYNQYIFVSDNEMTVKAYDALHKIIESAGDYSNAPVDHIDAIITIARKTNATILLDYDGLLSRCESSIESIAEDVAELGDLKDLKELGQRIKVCFCFIQRKQVEEDLRQGLKEIFSALQLKEKIEKNYDWASQEVIRFADDLANILLAFFADRLKVHLREQGVRHDLIAAVFAGGGEDDIVRLLARVDVLRDFLDTDDGANLLIAYRRASNIVRIEESKDATGYEGQADPRLLSEPQEVELHQALGEARGRISEALRHERFGEAMASLARLRSPVDAFFDHVQVNCRDPHLRANRLRLLSQIRSALGGVADFSQIEG